MVGVMGARVITVANMTTMIKTIVMGRWRRVACLSARLQAGCLTLLDSGRGAFCCNFGEPAKHKQTRITLIRCFEAPRTTSKNCFAMRQRLIFFELCHCAGGWWRNKNP